MKKIFLFFIFIFILHLSAPPSLAIPGQLIYDLNAPSVPSAPPAQLNCDAAIAPYIVAYKAEIATLEKKCQTQKSQSVLQQVLTNLKLTQALEQEKKKVFVLIGIIITLLVSLIASVVFLKKKPPFSH